MRILIGVDGSESSLDAVKLAACLLDPARDAAAIYFSPLELQKRLPGRSQAVVDDTVAAVVEEARRLLPGDLAARAESITAAQPAAVGLLDAAARWRADLLVVGARGHGSIERFLLGSVSRAVVHGASLPVLVVRAAPPTDRGLRVLACERPASAAALAAVIGGLHWPASTKGVVIGVAESLLAGPLPPWLEKRVRDPDTAAIAQAWQREHDDELAKLATELAAAQAGLPQAFRDTAPIVTEGNPSEKIMQQATQDGVDLIVLGRTPTDALSRWLLGSTSEAVLTHAPQSVLIVPVQKT
jgi:nucleotide-binding universal stress UspA family protein